MSGTEGSLEAVKALAWFYEFDLPDGSKTRSYLPEKVRPIHLTRERALREFLGARAAPATAIDVSCHEGFYSIVLAERAGAVTGVDRNAASIEKAKQITELLGRRNLRYLNTTLEAFAPAEPAEFVLCYGLLYHVENPVDILRRLAAITADALCLETQVLPFDVAGDVEDGSSDWQRESKGTFGLCVDYSDRPEGGIGDFAVVPSKRAVEYLLKAFGFTRITYYTPKADDYEQFVRGHRIILLAEKAPIK